ncbi:MAG: AarF/ABC1/UbiB kinase family protein [Chloroflexaceae bacterium]|nr:AarF/ABC1/UbiB kinase family protein [Chloroflexaceae bacterium]
MAVKTIIDSEPIPPRTLPRATQPPIFHPRKRFLRSLLFFLGVVAHVYIWDIFLPRFPLIRWYSRHTAMNRWVRMARKFRQLAIEMGGIQIKLGQFLSSRADIVPDEIRHELAGLQDEVPAVPVGPIIERIIEEMGAPPEDIFLDFDRTPVAAASLGQVHFARLQNGREVAVKVQRPNIDKIVQVDLSALSWVVRLIKDYEPIRRRADLKALFDEFSKVLNRELDYIQEARNAELFRANFANVVGIYVPEPVIEMTTPHVMVMERINGIKISDFDALDAAGVNRHELAERLNQTYLKQFFVDGFFHADPHPGNLFIRIEPPRPLSAYTNGNIVDPSQRLNAFGGLETYSDGTSATQGTPFTLIFIDFGMVGHLPPQTMDNIRDAVVGLATNDAERIVDALERARVILPGSDRNPIIKGVQVMLRYSYNRTVRELNNMDVEAIFDETQDLVYNMPFQLPQDLLYLGRAVSMVSGMATALEPDINLFESLRPFAHMMLENERRQRDWMAELQREATELGLTMLNLPRQMDAYYKAANRGELQTRTDFGRLERVMRRVEHSTDRLTGGLIGTGLFLGGVQLRMRGLNREANRAWWAAALALLWSFRPRGRGR